MCGSNPLRKFTGIGDCGREERKSRSVRRQHYALLPDNTALLIAQVVYLIKNQERCLLRNLRLSLIAEQVLSCQLCRLYDITVTNNLKGLCRRRQRPPCNLAYVAIMHSLTSLGRKIGGTCLADNFRAIVQHGAQDLRGHDQARGIRIDGDIASQQSHVPELLIQLPIFLHLAHAAPLQLGTAKSGLQ